MEDIEEDELARWALLRGMNIRATSSGFMAVSPPCPTLAPHADRLFCWKLSGLATAVICEIVCVIIERGSIVEVVSAIPWNVGYRDSPPTPSTDRIVALRFNPPLMGVGAKQQVLLLILNERIRMGDYRPASLKSCQLLSFKILAP